MSMYLEYPALVCSKALEMLATWPIYRPLVRSNQASSYRNRSQALQDPSLWSRMYLFLPRNLSRFKKWRDQGPCGILKL